MNLRDCDTNYKWTLHFLVTEKMNIRFSLKIFIHIQTAVHNIGHRCEFVRTEQIIKSSLFNPVIIFSPNIYL